MSNSLKFKLSVKRVSEDAVNKLLNRQNTKTLAKESAEIIRRRTRLGFGVDETGGPRKKLNSLSPNYISQRIRAKSPKSDKRLSRRTSPSKSNLTFTNQLLESLKGIVTGRGEWNVEPTGTRDDKKTNKDISSFVEDNGRKYLNFSNNEIKQLTNIALEILRRIVKNNLTKLK